MKTIEVCLSPDLIKQHEIKGKLAVVVDIFRATSCMITAAAQGVEHILPVAEVEEAKYFQAKEGYLAAGERQGVPVEGFDLDNSPHSYLQKDVKGKKVVITTTNGTQAIDKAKEAEELLIGSFLNFKILCQYLKKQEKDVIIICAAWRGHPNLEDTYFAGALVSELIDDFKYINDCCSVARATYHLGQTNPKRFLTNSSHFERLKKLGHAEDIDLCLTYDKYDVLLGREGKFLKVLKADV